jgi:hypothetical protein
MVLVDGVTGGVGHLVCRLAAASGAVLGTGHQYKAPRAVIGQIASTRLPRTPTYQS